MTLTDLVTVIIVLASLSLAYNLLGYTFINCIIYGLYSYAYKGSIAPLVAAVVLLFSYKLLK